MNLSSKHKPTGYSNQVGRIEITHHAVKRFLERVLKKSHFTSMEFWKAYLFLQKSFSNVVTHREFVPFPQIKGYVAVIRENHVVTIIEKNENWKKRMKHQHGVYKYKCSKAA